MNKAEAFVCKILVLNFLHSRIDYEKLTSVELFSKCVKVEHGGAATTLLRARLQYHVYSAVWEAAIG